MLLSSHVSHIKARTVPARQIELAQLQKKIIINTKPGADPGILERGAR